MFVKYCEKYFAEIQVYCEAGVMVTGMESEGKHAFESWLLDSLALRPCASKLSVPQLSYLQSEDNFNFSWDFLIELS